MAYEYWPNIPIPVNPTNNIPITSAQPWWQVYTYPLLPPVLPAQPPQVTVQTWMPDWRTQALEARIAKLERQVRVLRRERVARRRGGKR